MIEIKAKDALKYTNAALGKDLGEKMTLRITDELYGDIARQAKQGYTNLELDYVDFRKKVCDDEEELNIFDWGERGLRFIVTSLTLYGYRSHRTGNYISIHWN